MRSPGRQIANWSASLISCACLVVAVETSRAEDELWKNCSTPKTHYVLQVPGSLVGSTAPGATGCAYQTADGEFNIEAIEQNEPAGGNQTLDGRMQKEIDLLTGTVTYQNKGDAWFVLSGVTPDGTEYYRKHSTNGVDWVTLRITYPHAKHKKYDKWVKRIEKAFVAFSKTENDTQPRSTGLRTQENEPSPQSSP
jgi:hypothetical protein